MYYCALLCYLSTFFKKFYFYHNLYSNFFKCIINLMCFYVLSFIFNSLNCVMTPSKMIKINLWFFLNVQVFKNKFSSIITYFLESMSNLKFKKLKVYYNTYMFEGFFFFFYKLLIIFSVLLIFFLLLF